MLSGAVMYLLVLSAYAGPCQEYNATGIDYADANISVVQSTSNYQCCLVCGRYNNDRQPSQQPCLIGVWYNDAKLCMLKATAEKPVPRKLTVSMKPTGPVPPPPPAPTPPTPPTPKPSGANLIVLPNTSSVDQGAVCLDGSPPAIYYKPAAPSATKKWALFFKGGGWCVNETNCAARSHGELGSSAWLQKHQPTLTDPLGILSADPRKSDFAEFHHVVLWYCDGGSFTGDRDDPVKVQTSSGDEELVYFRGRRVLDAILDMLLTDKRFGMSEAEEVLLAGGSAGGLSVFLHADKVHARLKAGSPNLKKFRAAPVSGFFLDHASVQGSDVYEKNMRHIFGMMNSSGGVNAQCISATAEQEQWRCFFANASYAFTQAPIFPLNSAVDKYQMGPAIFDFNSSCASNNFQTCSAAEVAQLNAYRTDFLRDLQASSTYSKRGNGGFIESCLEHVAADNFAFNSFAIGGKTMRAALTDWYNLANGSTPATDFWHLPCKLSVSPPHQCNPTCK